MRLAAHMASYGSYHRDRRNRLTHFFGVPLIIFAILVPMSLGGLSIGPIRLSIAELFLIVVLAYYLSLDVGLALALGVIVSPMLWLADHLAERGAGTAMAVFIPCFLIGWAIQLLGHWFEGNRPALLDNLFQIIAAPIFLAGEAAFALGWKTALKREVTARLAGGAVAGTAPGSRDIL
jgi:uncharacterized membrane protein YGL010W